MKSRFLKRIITLMAFIMIMALAGCSGKTDEIRDNSTLPTLEVKDITEDLEVTGTPDQAKDTDITGTEPSAAGEEPAAAGDEDKTDVETANEVTPETTPEVTPEATPEVTDTPAPTEQPGQGGTSEGQTTGGEATADQSGDGEDEENKTDSNRQFVVVLDPGHGWKWAGACYIGLQEKDLTLKVAKYAREYLLNNYKNISVYLTREDDNVIDKDLKVDLEMRCELAKEVGADCLVSIHFNATDAHTFSGTEIWASRRSNVHDQTFALGECIMQELVNLGLKRRSVSSRKSTDMFDSNGRAYDYYAINRHCAARDIPGIIVEQCFMDSEYDQQFITSEEGLQSLGDANARGIAAYLGLLPKDDDTAEE